MGEKKKKDKSRHNGWLEEMLLITPYYVVYAHDSFLVQRVDAKLSALKSSLILHVEF